MVDFPDLNPFGSSGLPDLGTGATTKKFKKSISVYIALSTRWIRARGAR